MKNTYTELKAEEHRTTIADRKVETRLDDHLTIGQNQHVKLGTAQLTSAGKEIHLKAGAKIVIEAGSELTIKGGGSFIKLDAGGVTVVGPIVKINAGGSAGLGPESASNRRYCQAQRTKTSPAPCRLRLSATHRWRRPRFARNAWPGPNATPRPWPHDKGRLHVHKQRALAG